MVIPTYQRRAQLAAVLTALDAQVAAPAFRVVVVDDGSTDGTAAWLAGRTGPVPVETLLQAHRGPAAARNRGVRAARGPWIAFLGDDTTPRPGWLAALMGAAQAHAGEAGYLAVLGRTRWHANVRVTRFLEYAETEGLQFGYSLIEDPGAVPFNFLYTSNLLVHREALLAEPFCEDFPDAAWEDTEVSYRLERAGMRLVYEARAEVDHDHPSDFQSFTRRQEKAGYGAVVFHSLHPELGDFLGVGPGGPPPPLGRWRQRLRELVIRLLEPLPVRLPGTWTEALRYHYILGMRRAWLDGRGWLPEMAPP